MKIAVSGSTGLVGSALVKRLTERGHTVLPMVRRPVAASHGGDVIHWLPIQGTVESGRLEGLDAVVHLAGENISDEKWTEKKKQGIRDSRVKGTRILCNALAKLGSRPKVLLCASAIGYYGDRGDEKLTEDSGPGEGFLPEVCLEWEKQTETAAEAGIRVVNARIGIVLSADGGILGRVLPIFQKGRGGKIGSGRQYMSWVSLPDLIRAFEHMLASEALRGPVNCTAPRPVTNHEFTKTLGELLGKRTWLSVPGFVARIAFGQMADELLLASAYALPKRLVESGFKFQHNDLEAALRAVLPSRMLWKKRRRA